MNDKDPGRLAAEDQAATGYRKAVISAGINLAMHTGGATLGDKPGPADQAILERYKAWVGGDDVTECIHRPLSRGKPVEWLAWSPMFRCALCVDVNHQQMGGTEEDRRCDICKIIQPPGPKCINLGAYVLEITPLKDNTVIGPVTLKFGVCHACQFPA